MIYNTKHERSHINSLSLLSNWRRNLYASNLNWRLGVNSLSLGVNLNWRSLVQASTSIYIHPFYTRKNVQHQDKSHIIRNCGDHKYVKYKHERSSRNVHECTRENWHSTTLYALDHYHVIKVYGRNGVILFDFNSACPIVHPLQYYEVCVDLIKRWKRRAASMDSAPTPKLHFSISKTIDDPNTTTLVKELSELDPVLQRNLGIITESKNIAALANSIETGETIGVSDASLGSRARASHSYVLTTKSKNSYLKGTTPIDCDPR